MKLSFISIFLLIASVDANAFNYEECKNGLKEFMLPTKKDFSAEYEPGKSDPLISTSRVTTTPTILTLPPWTVLTNSTVIASGSTSSTGPCRMIDFRNKEKLVYIANNFSNLKVDIAKGDGEYFRGLSTLYECKDSNALGEAFKKDYSLIFNRKSDIDNTPSEAFSHMNDIIHRNEKLNKGCGFIFLLAL